jgi:hypothetical protein
MNIRVSYEPGSAVAIGYRALRSEDQNTATEEPPMAFRPYLAFAGNAAPH